MKVTVLGAGSFGTCLSKLLAENGHDVTMWSHSVDTAEAILKNKENTIYLPGISLPETLKVTPDMAKALEHSELVVSAAPTQATHSVLEQVKPLLPSGAFVVSASKGIEKESCLLVCDIFLEVLGDSIKERLFFLSGPSFAREVAMRIPTAVIIASYSALNLGAVQAAFHNETFRAYATTDVVGVELGGALKNVMAIATGISDGLGLGYNTRAAIITRGLAEIARLGRAMGADAATFMGLAGMGDLVLTCTGDLSRNRTVGVELGKGRTLADILEGMRMVAEGVPTTQSAHELAAHKNIEMPITESVYQILYKGKSPKEAIRELMTRRLKFEAEK